MIARIDRLAEPGTVDSDEIGRSMDELVRFERDATGELSHRFDDRELREVMRAAWPKPRLVARYEFVAFGRYSRAQRHDAIQQQDRKPVRQHRHDVRDIKPAGRAVRSRM